VIDEATRALRAREPAWDPLRERRVLARVEAELDARGGRPRRFRLPALGLALAGVAALAVLALRPSEPTPLALPALEFIAALGDDAVAEPSAVPGIPSLPAPAIALVDGSVATLYDGAALELRSHTESEIRIDQRGGRVHYEVRPDLPRSFEVDADGVRIQVVGTAFWVAYEPEHVRVTVEHGRVRVGRGDEPALAELTAGDELRLERGVDDVATPADASRARMASRARKPSRATMQGVSLPGVDELLARADAAAAARDSAGAIAALREIVERHGNDPQAYSSAFRLGKLERARGRHADAAEAFTAAVRHSPSGTLSADARAEAAIAWSDAGRPERARAAGDDYLARHPDGSHVDRVRRMLARLP
jgi:transmembrane sensor